MKNTFKLKIAGVMLVITALFITACDPYEEDWGDIGQPVPPEQLSFEVSQDPDDEFKYIFENTTGIAGITSWNLGGVRQTGGEVSRRFPLPDTYIIEMTLATKGGSTTISGSITTDDTDWAFLENEQMIRISGGVDAAEGKTWYIDSMTPGHLGVGPAGSTGLEWWAAQPLDKAGVGVLYGDHITFKFEGLDFIYENYGQSYVKDYRADHPAYSNAYEDDTDYVVDFDPPAASWILQEEGDSWFLYLNSKDSDKPIFPIFDVGAVDDKYRVLELTEDRLWMVAEGGDGNAWHYKFVREGFEPPVFEYDVVVNTIDITHNEYEVGLENVVLPEGVSFNKFVVDFGEGTVKETTNPNEKLGITYMRAGEYIITVDIVTTLETLTETVALMIEQNHPDYEEFILNQMIVYNNFYDIQMEPVLGENCIVEIVDNPERVYPNRGTKSAFYSKTNQEWANAYMQLPPGYRFDIREISTFSILVRGNAGDQVLLKLENTDLGGNAWMTGTQDLIYVINQDDTWELAEYDFSGVGAGWDWTGMQYTDDVTTDDNFSHNYYNIIRIMLNPGNNDGTHEFYFDELSGPHVEGIYKK